MRNNTKVRAQSIHLIEQLAKHPDATAADMKGWLVGQFGDGAMYVAHVVSHIRLIGGEEVLLCRHIKGHGWTYRLALSAAEGRDYVRVRKFKVRNQAANLVTILDRVEAKWPGDPEVRYAKAMLESVVNLLDV